MTTLPPYRHELRHVVKPLGDAFTAKRDRAFHRRFTDILDEVERLINEDTWDLDRLSEQYREVVMKCRESPGGVTDEEIALGLGAATRGTYTDIIGAFYQFLGHAESYHNQYFTPPNVATAASQLGIATMEAFDRPEPDVETVTGQASFGVFADDAGQHTTGDESDADADRAVPDGGGGNESLVVFDPACGSGRLLVAAARDIGGVTALGWELTPTAAHMTALTLALLETPGWVVQGDSVTMAATVIYRVSPGADEPLQTYRPGDDVEFPTEADAEHTTSDGEAVVPVLDGTVTASECVSELRAVLERGVDLSVGNPPFDDADLSSTPGDGPAPVERFDLAYRTTGDQASGVKSSERYEWLMLEHALNLTRPDGAVAFIIPESLQANPSEKQGRQWFMENAYLTASIDLPRATFEPETGTSTGLMVAFPRRDEEVGLTLQYEVFMAIAETMGHGSRATSIPFTTEDGDLTIDTSELPRQYTAHRWLDYEEITVPDDDLMKVMSEYWDFARHGETTAA